MSLVGIKSMDLNDQYGLPWLELLDEKDLKSNNFVWTGAVRDIEKCKQIIELAKNHIVIAITHFDQGSSGVIKNFKEMEWDVLNTVGIIAVLSQE